MNRNFLLPNKWKKWGFILFVSIISFGYLKDAYFPTFKLELPFAYWEISSTTTETINGIAQIVETNVQKQYSDVLHTITSSLILISMLLVFFTKQKKEDELIQKIRLDSLAWALIINSVLMIIISICLWSYYYAFTVTMNIQTLLLIAIFRYYYLLLKLKSINNSKDCVLTKIGTNKRFLIANEWKKWGWIFFLGAIALYICDIYFHYSINIMIPYLTEFTSSNANNNYYYFDWAVRDITVTLSIIMAIIGLLMITFCRDRIEDELSGQFRLDALSWAIVLNYILFIIVEWGVWGPCNYNLLVYTMFTPFIIFIVRFNYLKYKMRKSLANEIIEGEAL